MKISIITPCYQAGSTLRECVDSVLAQKTEGFNLEYIVMDGGSKDDTVPILESYGDAIHTVVSEPDKGPADAINKGFEKATGDIVAWLNADDIYAEGALQRVAAGFQAHPDAPFVFGHCPIMNEEGEEIRKFITGFKEMFFPVSSRFVFQCINYLSQPACFFRREAVQAAGPLRLDLKAAWDYEFLLRLWHQGKGRKVGNPPLAYFRWHEGSISGQHFRLQFAEEFEAAKRDAGAYSLQTFIHRIVRWGIVGAYSSMSRKRESKS